MFWYCAVFQYSFLMTKDYITDCFKTKVPTFHSHVLLEVGKVVRDCGRRKIDGRPDQILIPISQKRNGLINWRRIVTAATLLVRYYPAGVDPGLKGAPGKKKMRGYGAPLFSRVLRSTFVVFFFWNDEELSTRMKCSVVRERCNRSSKSIASST